MNREHHVVLIHGTWANASIWAEMAAKFERRGFKVHTPTLRYHDLPLKEGAEKLGTVSLNDYVDDIRAFIHTLDSPPILVGHSLGGLLAQLVAAQSPNKGLILFTPAPAPGIFAAYPSALRIFARYFLRWGFWRKPMYPPSWDLFVYGIANTQPPQVQREQYELLCADSGRVYFEMTYWFLDFNRAAHVDHSVITTPVIVFGCSQDRAVHPAIARNTAALYPQSTHVELEGSDHLMIIGRYAAVAMGHVDTWLRKTGLMP